MHVDLSPNGQDREEKQMPSNAKAYSGPAQPWRRLGMTGWPWSTTYFSHTLPRNGGRMGKREYTGQKRGPAPV